MYSIRKNLCVQSIHLIFALLVLLLTLGTVSFNTSIYAMDDQILPMSGGGPTCPAPNSTCNNLNWSGVIAQGHRYTSVTALWHLPYVDTSVKNASLSAWVGIGGTTSAALAQTVIRVEVDGNGNVSYYAIAENYKPASNGQPPQDLKTPLTLPHGLHAGDIVYTYVKAPGRGYTQFYTIRDYTTNEEITISMDWPGTDGSTAEVIVERPDFGYYKPLTAFGGSRNLYATESIVEGWDLSSRQFIGVVPHRFSNMVNKDGNSLISVRLNPYNYKTVNFTWLRAS